MWGYVALYVLFAAGVYLLDRFTHRSLFVRTQNRHFPWKLNFSLKGWSVDEYLALAISFCMVMMPLTVMVHSMGGTIDKTLARWLFAVLSLSSIVLTVRLLRLVAFYKRHMGWLTALAALLTIGLGLVASAEADAFILGQTRVTPGQFPLAQKTLTLIYLAYIWFLPGSFLLSLVMWGGALVYGLLTPGFIAQLKQNRLTAMCWNQYKPSAAWHRRQWLQASCVIGVIYTAVIILVFSEVVNSRLRTVLHEALVYASFHLGPEDCALPGLPNGTRLALLEKGEVVVAQPVEAGYRYGKQACELQSLEQIKAAREEQVRAARAKDAYF